MHRINGRFLASFLLGFTLTACAFVPRVAENQDNQCELVTKELTLELVGADPGGVVGINCSTPECVIAPLAVAAAVSTATLIVSGSIVVIGNTIHWLEQEGKCDDSVIRGAVTFVTDSAINAGGWIAGTSGELLDWLTGKNLPADLPP